MTSGRRAVAVGVGGGRPAPSRYAHPEREQRWLLAKVPAGWAAAALIEDHYLSGTTLRLRRVTGADGAVVHKLTQKVRLDPVDPMSVQLTNLYLGADEYELLLRVGRHLPLTKSRGRTRVDGRVVVVDRFQGRHAGLALAEIELTADEPLLPIPAFAVADVSHDERCTGGWLAAASDAEVRALVSRAVRPAGEP